MAAPLPVLRAPTLSCLELAVRIEDQDPDRVAMGDPGVLQRVCGVVGGGFIWEEGEYELLICHG